MNFTEEQRQKLAALNDVQIKSILDACWENNETDIFMNSPKAYIENHGYTFPYTYDYHDGIKKNNGTFSIVNAIGTPIVWPRPTGISICASICGWLGVSIGLVIQ